MTLTFPDGLIELFEAGNKGGRQAYFLVRTADSAELRKDIAQRIRHARPLSFWDQHTRHHDTYAGREYDGRTVLEEVVAEFEQLLVERTASLCAEVQRLRALVGETG